MTTEIRTSWDLNKLMAFLKVHAKGDFEFPVELAADIIERLKCFASENKVTIEIFDPTDERIITFTAVGALTGAGFGYLVAAVPGAVVGAMLCAVIGYQAAHIKIKLDLDGDRGHLTLV